MREVEKLSPNTLRVTLHGGELSAGLTLVPWSFDWYLIVGDETALPAIGRRIAEAPATANIISLGIVAGPRDEQAFETKAQHAAY